MFNKYFSHIFLLIIVIINLVVIGLFYPHQQSDLAVSKVDSYREDGIYHYNITLKSTKEISQKAVIETFFADGEKTSRNWQLSSTEKEIQLTGKDRLEYVRVIPPDSFKDMDPDNNSWAADLWSPASKIVETNINPEYSYIVDKKGNMWFVFTDKTPEKKRERYSYGGQSNKPQIYLSIISPRGRVIVKRKRLSILDEYSVTPDIKQSRTGNIYISWQGYHKNQDMVFIRKGGLKSGNLILTNASTIKSDGGLTEPELNSVKDELVLIVQEEKEDSRSYDRYNYLVIYKLQNGEFKRSFTVLLGREKSGGDWTGRMVKGLFYKKVLKDSSGYYYIIWGNKIAGGGDLFFNKITPEGKVIINNKKIKSLLMWGEVDFSINSEISSSDQIQLVWVEENNAIQQYYELNHLTLDTTGSAVVKEHRLTDPTPLLVSGINMRVDGNNNLHLVWSDEREGKPNLNQDIVYSRLNQSGTVVIPGYRITTGRPDESNPHLFLSDNNIRYLTWSRYKDNKFIIYYKNTDPQLKEILKYNQRWTKRISTLLSFLLIIILGIGCLVLFFIPFNIIPISGLLGYCKWATEYYFRNNYLIFSAVMLGFIPLKVLNEVIIKASFTNLIRLDLVHIYLINIITLIVVFVGLFLIDYLKKDKIKLVEDLDFQILAIILWFLSDTLLIFIANLTYYF